MSYELQSRLSMSNVGRQLMLVGHSRGQFRVARICPFLSRTVNRNLEPPDPLAEPADRAQNGPNSAFYTRFSFLHLNLLRKSLSFKHLQRARPIRPAKMHGISRRQWEPDAKDA
jgi:hypothetical protein